MLSFDFITNPQFRESLESDFREMENCLAKEAWKAAQVLAGSIVEALLIDYLHSYPLPSRNLSRDVLKLELAEAIKVCAIEGVLSKRVEELCGVVRSYRNLIHPGRVVRMNEPAPNRSDAVIALELVGLITREVARTLQKRVGLTAEQVLAKIKKDQGAVKMLKHLLVGFNETQRQRLLVSLLPKAYIEEVSSIEGDARSATAETLSKAYRIILEDAEETTKQACIGEIARVIREEDGSTIRMTTIGMLHAGDIRFAPEDQRDLIYEHIMQFSVVPHTTRDTLSPLNDIHLVLRNKDVSRVMDSLVRVLTSLRTSPWMRQESENILWGLTYLCPEKDVSDAVQKRLNHWVATYKKSNDTEKLDYLSVLVDE